MRAFLIGVIAVIVSGCMSLDSPINGDYQLGDGLDAVTKYQLQYCAEADPYQRSIAIALLQRAGAPLPDSGVCTDLAGLILDGSLPSVDTTEAEANREWAREQLNAVPE